MRITFAPGNILQVDDARIKFPNFSGKPSRYNREGDRNFLLVIDDPNDAERLIEAGWNVKIKDAREEGEPPYMQMKVNVKFNNRGPAVYLQKENGRPIELDEESIGILDDIDILSIDMDIRPYDWVRPEGSGRTAYLHGMKVVQKVDRFAAQFTDDEY